MSTFHSQGPGRDALGRQGQSVWRYRWLVVVAVLVGAVLGYGWAARQPAVYQGVSRVRMADRCPPNAFCIPLTSRAQHLLRSSAVSQRAVKLSGSRISADTLGRALEVEVARATRDADHAEVVATIRVENTTAKGAAQLANAVALASQQVNAEQEDAAARRWRAALAREQRQLDGALDALDHQLAADPGNARLQANRNAMAQQLNTFADVLREVNAFRAQVWQEQAAVPQEPGLPKPLGVAAIGGLLGLVVGAGLAWWRTRPPKTLTMAAAGGR